MEVSGAVYAIWWIVLAVAVLVVLPLTVYLLHRVYRAARSIERYLTEMRDAGTGIAENTSHIPALDDTIAVATDILQTTQRIKGHSGAVGESLTQRASTGTGRVSSVE